MALPSTGSISMSQVNIELKKSATATISLNDSAVRKLAGKTSGTISMNDLRGKKASESVTNYQIYSNSWRGENAEGSFSFSFPKKVISGKIIVEVTKSIPGSGKNPYVYILGTRVSVSANATEINVPSNTLTLNGTYFTGSYISNSSSTRPQTLILNIKFTGEWEA